MQLLGSGPTLLPSAEVVDSHGAGWAKAAVPGDRSFSWDSGYLLFQLSQPPGNLADSSRGHRGSPSLAFRDSATRANARAAGGAESRPSGRALCVTVTTHSYAGVPLLTAAAHRPHAVPLLTRGRRATACCTRSFTVRRANATPSSADMLPALHIPRDQRRDPDPGTRGLRPPSGPAQITSPYGPISAHLRVVSPNRHPAPRGRGGGDVEEAPPLRGGHLGQVAVDTMAVPGRTTGPLLASFQCRRESLQGCVAWSAAVPAPAGPS